MADSTVDLAVVGGTIITATGERKADLELSSGKVVGITEKARPARNVIDAAERLVFPGMVEAHAHFMDPGDPEREDFPAGSAAAAVAGVTTVIEHTHARPVVSAADLREKSEYVNGRSAIDFALGAHALPGRQEDVPGVWEAGAAFIKVFTCTTHGLIGIEEEELKRLLGTAAAANALCLFHCEDEKLTAEAESELRASERSDGGIVREWRNREAEFVALEKTARLAQAVGARAAFAHVSNREAIDLLRSLESDGTEFIVETCPQYLALREGEVDELGALRKFTPPARAHDAGDLEQMWEAVTGGLVDYVSSDHAPSTLAQKQSASIWDVHFGLPGVDTTFPFLLDAALQGLLPLARLAEIYAAKPAAIYGLAPAKGDLRPGGDADFILVDPESSWTVRREDILSRAGWSPFEGRSFKGRVTHTFLRGELIAENRSLVGRASSGRFLPAGGRS